MSYNRGSVADSGGSVAGVSQGASVRRSVSGSSQGGSEVTSRDGGEEEGENNLK